MPKNKVNNNIKLKSGGGIINGPDGFEIGSSMTAFENITAGNLLKTVYDSLGNVKLAKQIGMGAIVAALSASTNLTSVNDSKIIALSEDRYVVYFFGYTTSSTYKAYLVYFERQANGTFLSGAANNCYTYNDSSIQHLNLPLFKRINDNSFILNFEAQTNSGNYSARIDTKVCTVDVATRAITLGTGYDFGIATSGNNTILQCIDAVNLSGNNWLLYLSINLTTGTKEMKVLACQIDTTARTITSGTIYSVVTGAVYSGSLLKCSTTSGIAFYGTSYMYFTVNFATNVVTFPNTAQSSPVSGALIKWLESKKVDNTGVVATRNASSYAVISKYLVTAGIIALSQATVLTSVASSDEALYYYDDDVEEFLYAYTIGGLTKMRRIVFRGDVLTALQEVPALPITLTYGKQKIHSIPLSGTGILTSTAAINSLDLSQYFGVAQETVNAGAECQYKTIGTIYSTTDLILGKKYYVGQQGAIVQDATSVINGITYTNDELGIAISETELLLRK